MTPAPVIVRVTRTEIHASDFAAGHTEPVEVPATGSFAELIDAVIDRYSWNGVRFDTTTVWTVSLGGTIVALCGSVGRRRQQTEVFAPAPSVPSEPELHFSHDWPATVPPSALPFFMDRAEAGSAIARAFLRAHLREARPGRSVRERIEQALS